MSETYGLDFVPAKRTRGGYEYRILEIPEPRSHKLVATGAVNTPEYGGWFIANWLRNGQQFEGVESPTDLVPARKTKAWRIGRFQFVDNLIKDDCDLLASIFSYMELVVVRAEMLYAERVIEYTAVSWIFDPCEMLSPAPLYAIDVTIDDDRDVVSVKASKRNTHPAMLTYHKHSGDDECK